VNPHRVFASSACLLAVIAAATAKPAFSQRQTAALIGWIRDSTGRGVPQADVAIEISHVWTRTDSAGFFRLRALPAGPATVSVRRLGFRPATFEIQLHDETDDSVSVKLQENVQVLEAMRTNATLEKQYIALADFYRRRGKGSGTFFTRDDIERHHTNQLSDVLREAPGVRVLRGRTRGGVRFQSAESKSRDCPPQYWLDGRRVNGAELDDFPATDVEALEVYDGPATIPLQFSQSVSTYTCGAIVIWSRIPGLP
jgi:hypothetical protein